MKQLPRICCCTVGVALGLSTQALAQNSQSTRMLEEITVTAQKTSEKLQNVPISISVATAKDIKDINAFDFRELADITPGIAFGGGAGLQSTAIRIRGVGPAFFALGTPQSVAVFVDEVAQSQVGAVFSTMVDIERAELLRGPQGTLYGRNAPGGAYNIHTKRPNYDGINGYIEGSYSAFESSDLATEDLRGAINLPIVDDKLALRLAGVYANSDGYVRIVNPDSEDDTSGGKDDKSLRAKLLWDATDNFNVLWTSNYQDLEQNPAGFNYDGLVPGTGGSSPVPATFNDFSNRESYSDRRSIVTGETQDTSLHLTWDTDNFLLEAIGFYQEFDTFSDEQREPYPGGVSKFEIAADSEITTLELRVSNTGVAFDYVAGLYYFDSTFEAVNEIRIQGVDVNGNASSETEGYAAFANVNFHLSPQWDLAVGLRYDDVEDSLDSLTTFSGAEAKLTDDLAFDDVSWSVKLRNYLTEDITVYLAVDHAFKQGGFNGLVAGVVGVNETFGLPIPPLVEVAAADTVSYDEETSDAIELGIKGTFMDGRLRIAADIFYQEYQDHQVAQTEQAVEALGGIFGNFFIAAIANADEVTTTGIEFDVNYLLGEHWDFALRSAYSNASVEDWSSRFCPNGENLTSDQLYCPLGNGQELNNLPKFTSNFQAGYNRPLSGGWDLYSRASITFKTAPANTKINNNYSESKTNVTLTIGASQPDMGLDVRAWVKNLTDEDNNIDPGRKPNGDASLPDARQAGFSRGRELGVTLRYNF